AAEYQALEYAPVGQPVTWRGSNGRVSGQVSAAAPYRVGSQNCRQYVHTVRSGDSERTARGTACREADGRWSLLV
ncbi:MAG: RT0821/Lpp0805 family surface protein, partial [Rhizobiaceae bacterium]